MSLAIDISCKRGGRRKARFGCCNKNPQGYVPPSLEVAVGPGEISALFVWDLYI
jgi:hypothetical protein